MIGITSSIDNANNAMKLTKATKVDHNHTDTGNDDVQEIPYGSIVAINGFGMNLGVLRDRFNTPKLYGIVQSPSDYVGKDESELWNY